MPVHSLTSKLETPACRVDIVAACPLKEDLSHEKIACSGSCNRLFNEGLECACSIPYHRLMEIIDITVTPEVGEGCNIIGDIEPISKSVMREA